LLFFLLSSFDLFFSSISFIIIWFSLILYQI
jgi:hypothetical protein